MREGSLGAGLMEKRGLAKSWGQGLTAEPHPLPLHQKGREACGESRLMGVLGLFHGQCCL